VYAGLAGVLCLWLSTGPAAQATSSTSKTTVLVQAPVAPLQIVSHGRTTDGAPWLALLHTVAPSDGFVVDNKFDPGQTSGWHSHPGPSVIFVVTGTVTNHESTSGGCEVASYSAGSSFVDEGGDHVHMISNDGTQPAETIAVQFIPKGQPRRIDEPAPSC
jgi:quercetin dioxygenase-like cupin family protein